jgi:hypothetical protein
MTRRRALRFLAVLPLVLPPSTLTASEATDAPTVAAADWPPAKVRELLDASVAIRLAPDLAKLTPGERRAVDELLAAGAIFQRLYEDERHPQAPAVRARLERDPASDLATLYRLFQGPIATTLDNRREPFVGVDSETPGKNVYPWGVEAAEIEAFLAAHPERRAEILDDRSVVRRATAEALAADRATLARHALLAGLHPFLDERLTRLADAPDAKSFYAVPYSVARAEPLSGAYLHLMRAAEAVEGDDPELAGYLRNRARDLLSNDYEGGDASWITGRFGRLNAQIGAYETYDDALFGAKAFHSLSLLLRDDAATNALSRTLGSLQEIESALPYPKPKTVRAEIPIGVYDVIADFGQARSANTATNLPNDPLHSRKYGRIILMRANILRNPELGELAAKRWRAAVAPAHAGDLSGEGGFQRTLWHEIGHYLGPEYTTDGRPLDESLGAWADALEEMKSDLVSLFAYHELADRKLVTPEALRAVQASGILRTLVPNRPRRDQPYPTMQLAQFNFFRDRGLIAADRDGRLEIRYERYREVVKAMLAEALALQEKGDPVAAEAFFTKWTGWTEALHAPMGDRMAAAEGPRFRLMRYAALGD